MGGSKQSNVEEQFPLENGALLRDARSHRSRLSRRDQPVNVHRMKFDGGTWWHTAAVIVAMSGCGSRASDDSVRRGTLTPRADGPADLHARDSATKSSSTRETPFPFAPAGRRRARVGVDGALPLLRVDAIVPRRSARTPGLTDGRSCVTSLRPPRRHCQSSPARPDAEGGGRAAGKLAAGDSSVGYDVGNRGGQDRDGEPSELTGGVGGGARGRQADVSTRFAAGVFCARTAYTPLANTTFGAIIDSMAQLIVRNIEDELVDALKKRAAENGRSAEAEHRELLRASLLNRQNRNLKQHLLEMPDVGDDLDFEVPRSAARDVEL